MPGICRYQLEPVGLDLVWTLLSQSQYQLYFSLRKINVPTFDTHSISLEWYSSSIHSIQDQISDFFWTGRWETESGLISHCSIKTALNCYNINKSSERNYSIAISRPSDSSAPPQQLPRHFQAYHLAPYKNTLAQLRSQQDEQIITILCLSIVLMIGSYPNWFEQNLFAISGNLKRSDRTFLIPKWNILVRYCTSASSASYL